MAFILGPDQFGERYRVLAERLVRTLLHELVLFDLGHLPQLARVLEQCAKWLVRHPLFAVVAPL